jgi:hypothetical protein
MIPTWLQRSRSGATRATGIRLCPKCRAPILTGLDAEICAFTVRVDPTPITPLGEAIALLQGRATYNLADGPNRKELDLRDQWRITMPRKYPVLPEHRCGQPLDAFNETIQHAKTKKYAMPNECPY